MSGQLYELCFTATGEVRDSEGNLLNTVPIEETRLVTEAEAIEILKQQQEQVDGQH